MPIFKEMKWNLVFTAGVCIAAGLVLIFFPEVTARTLALALSIFLMALGLIRAIAYFARDPQLGLFQYDLVMGLVYLLAGIFILLRTEEIISLIPFLLGFVVTISGILKLQNSINMLRGKDHSWPAILVLALLNIIFGIVLLLNPFDAATTLIILLGAGLVYSGLSDLITIFLVSHRLKVLSKKPSSSTVIDIVESPAPPAVQTPPADSDSEN